MPETFEGLDWIRRNYKVPAEVGMRVVHEGRERGEILGADQQYVAVRFDGEQHASRCHPLSLDYGDGVKPADRLAQQNAHIDRVNELLNEKSSIPAAGEGRAPRVSLWHDGLGISIGLGVSNDTLLRLGGGDAAGYNPQVDRDRGDMLVLREWVDAVNRLLPAVPDSGAGAREREAMTALAQLAKNCVDAGDSLDVLADIADCIEDGNYAGAALQAEKIGHDGGERLAEALRAPAPDGGQTADAHEALLASLAHAAEHPPEPIARDDRTCVLAAYLHGIKRAQEIVAAAAPAAPVEGDGRDAIDWLLQPEAAQLVHAAMLEAERLPERPARIPHALRALHARLAAPVETGDGADARDGVALIAAERRRQVEQEGWTPEHDDQHTGGELAKAAGYYALHAGRGPAGELLPHGWPWSASWWKPSRDRVRDLAKSGALIAAEIDRLQRLALSPVDGAREGGGR